MDSAYPKEEYQKRLNEDHAILTKQFTSPRFATNQGIKSLIGTGGDFARIALCKLIVGPEELEEVKRIYYKAGRSQLLYLQLYLDRYSQYQWLDKSSPSFVANTLYGAKYILLSDNEQLLHTFFCEIKRLPEDLYTNKSGIAISYALKYLIMGDGEQAKAVLGDAYLKANSFMKGLGYVLAGILYRDAILIQKGIEYEIKMHKARNKTSVFYSIAEEATAWAKLAKQFGFEPDISNCFIHKGLLKAHNKIDYKDIIEVHKALGINPL